LDDDESEDFDERSRMLRQQHQPGLERKASRLEEEEWGNEVDRIGRGSVSSGESSVGAIRGRYAEEEHPRPVTLKDTRGRNMPASERAPVPRTRG
jgi:hypothetical protein